MISSEQTPEENLNSIWNHLEEAATSGSHPFREVTLSTVAPEGSPQSRILVLRGIKEHHLLMYTDSRSEKVRHIENNSYGCIQVWHPELKVQLVIQVSLSVITSGEIYDKHKAGITGRSRDSYTTVKAPGESIGPSHKEIERYDFDDRNYFAIIRATPCEMTALRLSRDGHLRLKYIYEAGEWKGRWIVP